MAKKKRRSSKKTVLVVDDERVYIQSFLQLLRIEGFEVIAAQTAASALELLEQHHPHVDAVVLDVMMPPGELFSAEESDNGRITGLLMGRVMKDKYPDLPIVGLSVGDAPEVRQWFARHGNGFLSKPVTPTRIVEVIREVTAGARRRVGPKCFIVHGHDDDSLRELKDYLQNTLGFGRPVVLRERPSLGRTIIEKFEDKATKVDLVFVLLTPDDEMGDPSSPDEVKRRARQNVIFEMGFFFGKLQRRSGRILVLHKGPLEIPSDISGLVYVDISDGISATGERIRLELGDWL